jgi:hypothetical protein
MNQPIEGLAGTDSGGDIKSSSELPASPNIPIGCPVSVLADQTSETSETESISTEVRKIHLCSKTALITS